MDTEIYRLLEDFYHKYGYDFRQYSGAHVKRRILNRLALSGLNSIAELREKVLQDRRSAALFLQDLSITVTEMFRDADFYRAVREKVIPLLKTYSFVKIWHAGCSTGQEVYSMAILLWEEGLYDRTTIYATDFNQYALDQAQDGIFTAEQLKEYTGNYQRAGGKEAFSEYYISDYNMGVMAPFLKKNVVWANHNLVTDNVFAEVHMVVCRNVLIYFNTDLQNRVQKLFCNSLVNGGILCLGTKESLRFSAITDEYLELDRSQKIFKKKY